MRLLKEPLLHFVAGGTVLFAAYAWLDRDADALVRVDFADGNVWVERLTPRASATTIPALQTELVVAAIYVRQGIEHILFDWRAVRPRDNFG